MDWFALRVRPRHEKVVEQQLSTKLIEVYLPLHASYRCWSDRNKAVQTPLFPGYVFCRFDLKERRNVLAMPSVVSVVGFGGSPCTIGDAEIQTIKRVIASGLSIASWPCLRMGELVRVCGGPLLGLQGILAREKTIHRVVVNMVLLHRAVAVEIEREFIRPIKPASTSDLRMSASHAATGYSSDCF
jgi:transcription antitermination factor NusG